MTGDTTRAALAVAVALLATTAGCSTLSGVVPGGSPTPTPEGTEPTPTPTASGASPAPTPTPAPTATPAATPTPTASPTASPTSTVAVSGDLQGPTVEGDLNTGAVVTTGYVNGTGRQIERALADDDGRGIAGLLDIRAYTLRINTTVVSGGRTVVTNQTLRVDREANRTYLRTERTIGRNPYVRTNRINDTQGPRTLVTERYSAGNGTYVRQAIPGGGATYYYRPLAAVARTTLAITNNSTAAAGLDSRIDFETATTTPNRTVLVADSVDQLYPSPARKDVQDISVRVVVDEDLGLVRSVRYRVELSAGGGTVVYDTRRRLTRVGTDVRPPDWLSTAKKRTAG